MIIQDNDIVPRIGLGIDITNDCNMDCPWCIGEHLHNTGVWSNSVKEKFYNHINKYDYSEFSLHGGESLLYPEETIDVFTKLRIRNPKAVLKLFTNGSLLTHDIVEKLNTLDVNICVSIQASGYKDLLNLISKAVDPINIIQIIQSIKRGTLRIIILKGNSFINDVILLHNIFDKLFIEAFPDYNTLNKLTIDDINKFQSDLYKLKSLDSNYYDWFSLNCSFTNKPCACKTLTRHFFVNGDIGWKDYISDDIIMGCAMFRDFMNPEIYKAYTKLKG